MNRLVAALCIGVSCFSSFANTPVPSEIERTTATFIANGFKAGLGSLISDIKNSGIQLDSLTITQLVAQEMTTPYSATDYEEALNIIRETIASAKAAKNNEFLANAASRPGAKTLDDGVILETIIEGVGQSPQTNSTIAMRYTGYLPDGTIFDTISNDEEPLVCELASLVSGFSRGLLAMRVGGRYILTIPAEVAYGAEGIAGVIPGNSPIAFEVELIEIK